MKRIHKKNLIVPVFLFIVVLGIYLYTSPRLPTGFADSEELMSAVYTLGVPHPPGYPLFVIFAKPFTYIPIGTIAFRFSIFSSFFGALTIVLVYLILLKIFKFESGIKKEQFEIKQKQLPLTDELFLVIPALVGALTLAFSYSFWLYTIVPEVFCVSDFFVALLIYILISWYIAKKEGKRNSYPVLFLFTLSLGFLSQQIIGFLFPAFLYFIWIIDKKILIPSKRWFKLIGAALLGLLPLIYLPLAALRKPILDYGNPTNLERFWALISRKVYTHGGSPIPLPSGSTFTLNNLEKKISLLSHYWHFLISEFTLILVCVAIIGLFLLIKSKKLRGIGSFLILSFIFVGPILASLMWTQEGEKGYSFNALGAQQRMSLMSLIVISIFVGIGVFYLLKLIRRFRLKPLPIFLIFILFSLLPLYPLRANFSVVNKRNFHLGQDLEDNFFINIKPNAILFVRGDRPTFAAQYYQLVEKKRLDVIVLAFGSSEWDVERWKERYPGLFDTNNKALLAVFRDVIRKNIGKRPIYITGLPTASLIQMGLVGNPYVVSPRGLVCEVGKDFNPKIGYWNRMIWHGPKNIDYYYDWYAKELIEQYIIGLSNNYYHYRIRNYYNLAKREFLEAERIAPNHPLSKKMEASFKRFSEENNNPRKFVLGPAKDHFDLARRYLMEKKVAEAMSEYWTAVYIEPENNVYRLQLGGTYELLGWYEEAFEQYKKILESHPKEEDIRKKAEERIEVVGYKLGK